MEDYKTQPLPDDSKSTNGDNTPVKKPKGFQKGNKHGKGNPFMAEVAKLRSLMFEQIRKDDWIDVREALISKAKNGDIRAMTLLLNYALGKPKELIELQGLTKPEEMKAKLDSILGLDAKP